MPIEATAPRYAEALAEITRLYPGRSVLKVGEFARLTASNPRHVFNMIEAGELVAVNIGNTHNTKSGRKCWRIPLSAAAVYLAARRNV